ncbi:MAG: RecQ family ATP-dependent DNA helicase [Spirochaetia bacterium]|jgi:ATP-dependent DNA helicase RecQ|nr:RecQ family ATP-dependent DNA helicase [Spirochaetia bacterium]
MDIALREKIHDLAEQVFGIDYLFPYQELVITEILEAEERQQQAELLVLLPTGSGKSLCFLLPALLVQDNTLLIYPLRSLQRDQETRLEKSKIPFASFHGNQNSEERAQMEQSVVSGKAKLILTNPETLDTPAMLSFLRSCFISLVVIDEAHVVCKWGLTFRPAYCNLGRLLNTLHYRQLLAFTATADATTLKALRTYLFHDTIRMVRGSCDRKNISYYTCRTLAKDRQISLLLRDPSQRPAIVFCSAREETVTACNSFRFHGFRSCAYYHAGLDDKEKQEKENWFLQSDDGVLFATTAYGMGVDKKNVRTTIHRSLCNDALAFLQESGRAGRDKKPAKSYVLLGMEEIKKFISGDVLASVFFSENCYRKALCRLLGEEVDGCSGCSVCDDTVEHTWDGEKEIVSLIAFAPLRYTVTQATKLLCGMSPAKRGNSRWGILSSWKEKDVQITIRCLVSLGIFGKTKGHLFYKIKRRLHLESLFKSYSTQHKT